MRGEGRKIEKRNGREGEEEWERGRGELRERGDRRIEREGEDWDFGRGFYKISV